MAGSMSNENIAESLSPIKQALLEIRRLRGQVAAYEAADAASREPIAIVGMALRMPGGISTPEAFWKVIEEGKSCVTEVPTERWNIDEFFSADPTSAGKMSSRYGAFLDDIDKFDAEFFGISPREAEKMDPQHRLLVEVAWESLEDAGITPAEIAGSQAGVYLGLSNSDYGRMLLSDAAEIDPHSAAGGALSIAAGRLSYFFNLRGASMVVDTACSSSLVALHLACASLRADETDLAIVGGANLILLPETSVGFSRSRMLAADGRCKTFDRDADGYVRGEGCVAIILMKVSDALRSGRRIHALCRGSAINQDGKSAGLTAPNGPSQENVVRAALKSAGIAPADVAYVECHGTGTALGDPIEVQALANVFTEGRTPDDPLRIGSVKANVGHLEAAAGLAGLVKTILAFEHSALPGQINVDHLNPYVAWDEMPIEVVRSNTEWKRGRVPRIAGVSSFGFSGTNAHVVIQEAPCDDIAYTGSNFASEVFCLSARTTEALHDLAERYEFWLETNEQRLCDICFTANAGRAHHQQRIALLSVDVDELKGQLRAWLDRREFHSKAVMVESIVEQEQTNNTDGRDSSMRSVQERYLRGDKIDWTDIYKDRKFRIVSLPHYPFQRKSYWLKPLPERGTLAAVAETAASIESPLPMESNQDQNTLQALVTALPPQVRYEWMFGYVTGQIRASLHLEPGYALAPRDHLSDIGMDSLIALELRSAISSGLGLGDRISATIAFDAGTVAELVRVVFEATFPAATQSGIESSSGTSTEVHRFTAEELNDLSDEEVERLIAASVELSSSGSNRV